MDEDLKKQNYINLVNNIKLIEKEIDEYLEKIQKFKNSSKECLLIDNKIYNEELIDNSIEIIKKVNNRLKTKY